MQAQGSGIVMRYAQDPASSDVDVEECRKPIFFAQAQHFIKIGPFQPRRVSEYPFCGSLFFCHFYHIPYVCIKLSLTLFTILSVHPASSSEKYPDGGVNIGPEGQLCKPKAKPTIRFLPNGLRLVMIMATASDGKIRVINSKRTSSQCSRLRPGRNTSGNESGSICSSSIVDHLANSIL